MVTALAVNRRGGARHCIFRLLAHHFTRFARRPTVPSGAGGDLPGTDVGLVAAIGAPGDLAFHHQSTPSISQWISWVLGCRHSRSRYSKPGSSTIGIGSGDAGATAPTTVNAVELMYLANPPDPRRQALLPVVRYAVERRLAAGTPDYWDHSTPLELPVLEHDEEAARRALADALATLREPWEAASTLHALQRLRRVRETRDAGEFWFEEVESEQATAADADEWTRR